MKSRQRHSSLTLYPPMPDGLTAKQAPPNARFFLPLFSGRSSSVWPEALAALLYQVHESARIGLLLVPNIAMSDHRLAWSDSEKSLLVSLRHRLPIATVKQLTDIFNMNNHQERSTTAVRTKLRMLGLSRRPQCLYRVPVSIYTSL